MFKHFSDWTIANKDFITNTIPITLLISVIDSIYSNQT